MTDVLPDKKHLLVAQAASESQRKGKPGQLVDPRPETVEGGEIKIRITPQLVHDIFDEYPVVAKAYSDNVPNKVCMLSHVFGQHFFSPVECLKQVVRRGFLEAIFPVEIIQRSSCFHPFLRCPTRRSCRCHT